MLRDSHKQRSRGLSILYLQNLLILILLSAWLSNCATNKFAFELVQPTQDFSPKTIEFISPDSQVSVTGLEFTFPSEVNQAEYDPHSQSLLVSFSPKKGKNDYVLCDLENRKARWMAKGNPEIGVFSNNDIILRKGTAGKIYDATDGSYIRERDDYLYVLGDGKALILSPKKFALIEMRSGDELWQRQGSDWKGFRWELNTGEWMYIVAEGLHAFRVESGDGWDFSTSTSHAAHGKEMARQAALTCLAALGGGYNTTRYHAELTHNVCSFPLPKEDWVFFAARKKVFCFNRETGEVIWETEIDEEIGAMDIYGISSDRIALVGNGWKFVDFVLKKAKPPSVRIFNAQTGELTGKFELEDSDPTMDFEETETGYLLLTPDKLYHLDQDLEPVGILGTTANYGVFLQILSKKESVIIRTSLGILAVSPASLEQQWFVSLGLLPVETPKAGADQWKAPIYIKNYVRDRSRYEQRIYWTPIRGGLAGIDLKNGGKTVMEIPLSSDKYSFQAGGKLLNISNKSIRFLSFRGEEQIP